MTIGRDTNDKVDHVLIDDSRRLVLAPVEAAPRSTGRATRPVIGRLTISSASVAHVLDAQWENKDGAVASADLPPFLSWSIQIKSGSAVLLASLTGSLQYDIPEAPGAFSETEGSSVEGWYVKNLSETDNAVLQIMGTALL